MITYLSGGGGNTESALNKSKNIVESASVPKWASAAFR